MLFFSIFLFGYSSALAQGETCVANKNCDAGLHCETCVANGNVRPRCTRIEPVNPLSKVKGLPFNRYTWLTTHNAFARLGARSVTGNIILSPENQQDSITGQLKRRKCKEHWCSSQLWPRKPCNQEAKTGQRRILISGSIHYPSFGT